MPRSDSVVHYIASMQTARMACDEPHPVYGSMQPADVTCPACCKVLMQGHMPESALLRAVREAASARGFLCYHTQRSDRSDKGWFDVALAKPGHPLYLAELKTATGKLTEDQARWQTTVAQCTGVSVHLWRPADLPAILALLKEKTP